MAGRKGSGVLELAVLGLLHETPMHGYELRKRLNTLLGMFRAFSYGTLYPCLKQLLTEGLIAEERPDQDDRIVPSRRSKIVYRLTADGKERLQQLLRPGLVEGHAGRADGVQAVRVVVHAQHGQPPVGERQCERQAHAAQPDDRDVQRHQRLVEGSGRGAGARLGAPVRSPARAGGSARIGGRSRR